MKGFREGVIEHHGIPGKGKGLLRLDRIKRQVRPGTLDAGNDILKDIGQLPGLGIMDYKDFLHT